MFAANEAMKNERTSTRSKLSGFTEGEDYYSFLSNRVDGLSGKPQQDAVLTIDMAKNPRRTAIRRGQNINPLRKMFLRKV